MNVRAGASLLAFLAVPPVWAMAPGGAGERAEMAEKAEAPPWKHRLGLRFGTAGLHSGSACLFYENQLDAHWAIRPAIELTSGSERYPGSNPYAHETATVGRAGAHMDCVYYVSGRGQDGTGLYLLAGLGAHSIDVKDKYGTWNGWQLEYRNCSDVAPALSAGLGYYPGRFCGLELKYLFSTLSTPFPGVVGKNWVQFTLNIRFPVPGAPREGRRR